MKCVIINADDFGRSKERNKAIDDSFKMGLISSAGLIVTGKYLQDALEFIEKGDYAEKIHLHFNLSTSLRGGDPEDAPLTEAMRRDASFCSNGRFFPNNRISAGFKDILKWRIVYQEMVAQYKRFIEVTDGKADYFHIDFHLWINLSWSVSFALNLFTWRYKIKSVRYIGMHQARKRSYRRFLLLSRNPFVKRIPATNIDYYLSNKGLFYNSGVVELYCHPNYKDGFLLDDSPSYIKHERKPMLEHIQMLKASEDMRLMSWNEIK